MLVINSSTCTMEHRGSYGRFLKNDEIHKGVHSRSQQHSTEVPMFPPFPLAAAKSRQQVSHTSHPIRRSSSDPSPIDFPGLCSSDGSPPQREINWHSTLWWPPVSTSQQPVPAANPSVQLQATLYWPISALESASFRGTWPRTDAVSP